MKCVYPCKLIAEKNGGYSVIFPDFAGGTQGENLFEALEMAGDFANFAVASMEECGEKIPNPSNFAEIEKNTGEFIQLICVDTDEYRRKISS